MVKMKHVKSISILLVCAGLMLLWSCVPKPVVVTQPPPEAVYPGHQTVFEADGNFESRKYDQALKYYRQYMELFPDGPAVPRVLLRIGTIQNILGNHLEAHTRIAGEGL